jgi:hypothetical protein
MQRELINMLRQPVKILGQSRRSNLPWLIERPEVIDVNQIIEHFNVAAIFIFFLLEKIAVKGMITENGERILAI